MADYRIELQMAEPVFCGSRHAASNEMRTLEFIPGTSLRGALAAELAYSERAGDVPRWFGDGGPVWTPALPRVSEAFLWQLELDAAVTVPAPFSFLREKADRGADPGTFGGKTGVWNSLFGRPPQTAEEYRAAGCEGTCAQGRLQWLRPGAHWLVVAGGKPKADWSPGLAASMHLGLHYGRQANREQALFSRRAVAAGTEFVAWVRDAGGVLERFPNSATIGKRTSAGNGRAKLSWMPGGFPWQGEGGREEPEAFVQLITDAVIRGPGGNYRQGLDAAEWSALLGCEVTVLESATAARQIRGWSTAWGLPRESMTAVAAGSVYRLRRPEKAAWKAALDRLAEEGIGALRHEGFGWVAVNPPWLKERFYKPIPASARVKEERRKRDPGPRSWPGMEGAPRGRVMAAYDAATQLAGPDVKDHAGQLASYAARVQDPEQVKQYLSGLAGRTNPRNWKEFSGKIGEALGKFESIELVRFFLNAVETLS